MHRDSATRQAKSNCDKTDSFLTTEVLKELDNGYLTSDKKSELKIKAEAFFRGLGEDFPPEEIPSDEYPFSAPVNSASIHPPSDTAKQDAQVVTQVAKKPAERFEISADGRNSRQWWQFGTRRLFLGNGHADSARAGVKGDDRDMKRQLMIPYYGLRLHRHHRKHRQHKHHGRSYASVLHRVEDGFEPGCAELAKTTRYDPFLLDIDGAMSGLPNLQDSVDEDHMHFASLFRKPIKLLPIEPRVSPELTNLVNTGIRRPLDTANKNIAVTLKLRSLKTLAFKLADRTSEFMDIDCISIGWVYFERLALLSLVEKSSRLLILATAFVIAFKFHTAMKMNEKFDIIVEEFNRVFKPRNKVTREEINRIEFSLLVNLEFKLQVSFLECGPHILHYCSARFQAMTFEDLYGVSVRDFLRGVDCN